MTLRKLLLSLVCVVSSVPAFAVSTHVNIAAVGGAKQTVAVGQQLPLLFVAQATYDDGSPVVGLDLVFSVNMCASLAPSGTTACPDPSVYGHFVGTAIVTTDALGKALAPPFVAGTSTGAYSVYAARANWSQLINGQTLTDFPVASGVSNLFNIIQAAPVAADPVPTLGIPALLLLAAMLGWAARRAAEPA
jgi:hypothetical protein